ncbi:hypothetical protein Bca4012_020081 [Brassica carinata]|uniref:Uncharacterized protein n=1 Tax=Brassica carinata TaxID=52824 RepID=A0A8X7WK98_BRACI|nr:hypothetical protein Bca52824_001495 [Brassica carinata]
MRLRQNWLDRPQGIIGITYGWDMLAKKKFQNQCIVSQERRVLKMEQQALCTRINKPWDLRDRTLAICLRVLWCHREKWYRTKVTRLQIEESYAVKMERYIEMELDCPSATSNDTGVVEDNRVFPKRVL